jgi:hypothetical protein
LSSAVWTYLGGSPGFSPGREGPARLWRPPRDARSGGLVPGERSAWAAISSASAEPAGRSAGSSGVEPAGLSSGKKPKVSTSRKSFSRTIGLSRAVAEVLRLEDACQSAKAVGTMSIFARVSGRPDRFPPPVRASWRRPRRPTFRPHGHVHADQRVGFGPRREGVLEGGDALLSALLRLADPKSSSSLQRMVRMSMLSSTTSILMCLAKISPPENAAKMPLSVLVKVGPPMDFP